MGKELNLLRSHHRSQNGKGAGWLRAFYVPAAALLLTGLCLTGIFQAQNRALAGEISAVKVWLAAAEPQFAQAERKWAYNEALMARRQAAEDLTAALATYPGLTSSLIARISAVGGETVTMTLEGWEAESGTLSFRAESSEVIDIPLYVRALRETGLFQHVEYTGYQYRGEGYVLALRCVLEEGGSL